MNEDGTMSRVPQLVEFCREHGLKNADGGRFDPLPHAARALRPAGGGGGRADRASASSR